MEYCARCVYPANAKPTIILDEMGVCSGCRHHESRDNIDWAERERMLRTLLMEYKAQADNELYDCIVPVSGGKDSHYLVYLVKEVYGLNPLCVTFNHVYNTALGIKNLANLVDQFGVDLIRLTHNPESVRKISRYMVKKVGDLTWHYHAGIMTFPFQIAVKYRIPLIVWPEHYGETTGIFTLDDMVEFTKWVRQEHDMRGLEPEDLVNDPESGLTWRDLAPYHYPTDEEIEDVGVRGIYITNYLYWDEKDHGELMIDKYKFQPISGKRDRTFKLYAKTDDHANHVHDYMRYLKFGYGRASDDATHEIRRGRMTREEAIEQVKEYDHVRPWALDTYLDFLGLTEQEFEEAVEPMRDLSIWEKGSDGKWSVKDSVANHVSDPNVEAVRLPQTEDRTFSPKNRHLYYYESEPQESRPVSDTGDLGRDQNSDRFVIL